VSPSGLTLVAERCFLARRRRFIDLKPELAAMRAGRLMLELIGDLVARGESFAFETTLVDRGYVRRIAESQRAGYDVTVLFLSLPSADAAIRRVRWRVNQGGHAIPQDVIRRRFAA
jgi:predicted ABC-type ATPase